MLSKARLEILKYYDIQTEKCLAICKLCKQHLKNDRVYCLKMHLQKVHNPNSELCKYFETIPGEGVAMCKVCQHRVRNNRSYFLRQHLQLMHMITITDMGVNGTTKKQKSNKEEKINNNVIDITDEESQDITPVQTGDRSNNLEVVNKEPLQNTQNEKGIVLPTELNKKYLCIAMDKETLMSSVWGLMLEDDVTPPLMDSPNMKSLLQPICKAITKEDNQEFKLNQIETEKLVCLAANKLRQDFISNFEGCLLNLKLDMDLNSSPNIFSLNALVVQDGKIQTYGLGIIDLKNDSQLRQDHIKQVLHKFNIDSKQIVHICCDFSKAEYHRDIENSEYLKEIHKFEYFPDIEFGDIKIEPYAGVIAQLCLLDIFKNPVILNNFFICRNFTKCINDLSQEHLNLFEENFLTTPELDSPWKWGSTYKMMYNLQQSRSILKDLDCLQQKEELNKFIHNENMWLFIDAYCELLNFIQKSIIKFYTEEMHYGDFYAQWLKSKLLTSKVISLPSMKDNPYINVISTEMLKSMDLRSKEILAKDYFEACLYLDPRFHHTLMKEDKNKALVYLKKLWNHFRIYNPYVINSAKNPQEESVKTHSFIDEEDAFLNEFLNPGDQDNDAETLEVYSKIENLKIPFKSVDTNILTLWQNLKTNNPELYELSAICFALPTTQNYNQSRHSHIYKMDTFTKISDFTRDNLVNLRLNSNLVKRDLKKIVNIKEKQNSSEFD